MKNLKTLIAILAISISSMVPAAANTITTPNPDPVSKTAKTILRAEIVQLLGNHKYELEAETLVAQVSVILNNNSELVVVGVKTDDKTVANFVKTKLNYKKVDVKGIKKGVVFRVPLKMTQSS